MATPTCECGRIATVRCKACSKWSCDGHLYSGGTYRSDGYQIAEDPIVNYATGWAPHEREAAQRAISQSPEVIHTDCLRAIVVAAVKTAPTATLPGDAWELVQIVHRGHEARFGNGQEAQRAVRQAMDEVRQRYTQDRDFALKVGTALMRDCRCSPGQDYKEISRVVEKSRPYYHQGSNAMFDQDLVYTAITAHKSGRVFEYRAEPVVKKWGKKKSGGSTNVEITGEMRAFDALFKYTRQYGPS